MYVLVPILTMFALNNQIEKCREIAATLLKEDAGSEIPILILAAAHVRDKKFDDAVQLLKVFFVLVLSTCIYVCFIGV